MISHKLRAIFVHIPNTTGTIIENALMNSSGQFKPLTLSDFATPKIPAHAFGYDGLIPWAPKHYPARFLKDDYQGYYKFCFIRNPWELIVSSYNLWTHDSELEYRKLQRRILENMGFTSFIYSCYTDYINEVFHCGLGQSYWILDEAEMPCVDFIGRFENLQEDFAGVLKRIGLPPVNLSVIKESNHKNFREYYTPQTRSFLKKKFKRDIEAFDYHFTETVKSSGVSTQPGLGNDDQTIWLASWPRSGNTFLRTILWQCYGYKSTSIYPNDLSDNKPLEEYVGHVERTELNTGHSLYQNSLILVKTHEPPLDENPAIYVVRDGRPACVSLWKFYNQKLPLASIVAGQHRFGSWARHIELWNPRKRPHTLFLRYEEMLADLQGTIDKIAVFLNRDPIRNDIPPRENIAKVGGQHVKLKSDWSEVLKEDDLDLFWQINGKMMEEIYGEAE